jgi:uncharacterized protein YbbC (DUF1343 family)
MSLFINPLFLSILLSIFSCTKKTSEGADVPIKDKHNESIVVAKPIITGAEQTSEYLGKLQGKRVAILANPTSMIGKTHLVDSLSKLKINITKIFGPEHGFRGNASAGIKVDDDKDPATGIKVISLYGKKRKPTAEDLANVDVMVFDIQDVGCRFYTYINVLRDIMEACAENNKPVIVLDRPNPNGYLVDGPILDMQYKSGIGQFPIPIAHGMTIGEFANMINGEKWLPNNLQCKVEVIKVKNYAHDMDYVLPVKPSPNLNTQQSVLLYPSTCLFEGTIMNLGRGTQFPFTILGAPKLKGKYTYSYTPTSIKGMAETPLHLNELCYGLDLRKYDVVKLKKEGKINLSWIQELYNAYPDKADFFNMKLSNQIGDINKLSGTEVFKNQIINNVPESEIRKSWEPGLSNYKVLRKKYLLYP